MSDFLRSDDLWRVMVRAKIDQTELRPEYIPPEGSDVPPDVELKGFKRDFDVVMEKIMQIYPDGVSKTEFADYLTRLSAQQKSNSAGPYLAATFLEIRDVVAPGYVDPNPPAAASRFMQQPSAGASIPADRVIAKLREGGDSYDQEVLDDVQKHLPRNATTADLKAALGDLTREYSVNDDYFAEVASGLKGKADRVAEAIAKEPAVAPAQIVSSVPAVAPRTLGR